MTVKEACKKFSTVPDMGKKTFIKSIITTQYLPILAKYTLIEETLYQHIVEFSGALACYDSVDKLVYFMMSVIQGYTNLEIEDQYSDFDALMQSGLMDFIADAISVDYEAYNTLFEMKMNDIIREHNTVAAVIDYKATELLAQVIKLMDKADESISKLDTGKIVDFLNVLKEAEIKK